MAEETQAEDSPHHDPERTLADLAEKLAARRRHVVFLLGAGTGCAAGLPDLAGLAEAVGDRLEGIDKDHYQRLAATRNIEEILTHLRLLVALAGGTTETIEGVGADEAQVLDRRICSSIASVILETETSLEHHERFATWVARSRYDTPIELFTTNYDLLLEFGLERAGAAYFDGFVGTYEGRFRIDLVDPPASTAGVAMALPPTWARLWKLHGSVSWIQDETGATVRLGAGARHDPERALVIYPSLEKYAESRRLPFVTLADRFRRALAGPETVVVVCGYSFGDEHINELLFEGARHHPRSETIALCHGEIPDAVAVTATEVSNFTALGRTEGVISGLRAPWRRPAPHDGEWDGFVLTEFAALSAVLARQVAAVAEGAREDG